MIILNSVFNKTYNSLTLDDRVNFSKEIGFDGVEYIASIQDLFLPPKYILACTKKYKVQVSSVHIPLLLTLYTPQVLFSQIKKLMGYFPDCQRFNFHLSGFLTPFDRNVSALEKFKELMEKNKITMSCESNPDEYIVFKHYPKETYDPDLFARFCMQHKIAMNLDTSHIAAWDYNIVSFFKKYYKQINLIHLSDMTLQKQHLPFGKGKLPLKTFFEEIKKVSYKGVITFEISNFSNTTTPKEEINELKNNLSMFKAIIS